MYPNEKLVREEMKKRNENLWTYYYPSPRFGMRNVRVTPFCSSHMNEHHGMQYADEIRASHRQTTCNATAQERIRAMIKLYSPSIGKMVYFR